MQDWNPQKATKLDGNGTTTSTHHPYILCHFAYYAHHKTLYMSLAYSYALMNKILSFAHSTVLHIKDDPYLPCSAAIKFHSITLQYAIQTQHCSCTPQYLHTLKTDRIWHAQPHWSHPQHKSLPMHINIHYTPTTTHPTASNNPSLHTTNKHKLYLCKWQQNGQAQLNVTPVDSKYSPMTLLLDSTMALLRST